jgi:NAD-dependent dihydropyrimidine dehydrogenase PreA subunit
MSREKTENRKGAALDKFIEVNPEKCTACRLCEFACSTHHFMEINPAKSRL